MHSRRDTQEERESSFDWLVQSLQFEPEMTRIPAGEFLMGSDPAVDRDAHEREQPQHRLALPEYALARTPVTNAQYLAFLRQTDHRQPKDWQNGHPPRGKEAYPVVNVSWHDALAYCRWLAEVTGKRYRLPSEAEWEKGARGTDGRIYPWGNTWDAARCNSSESGSAGPTPVGVHPQGASPYGLQDVVGNVWEWTLSLWGADRVRPEFNYPYDPVDGREELSAGDEVQRVFRGSAWYYGRQHARCAERDWGMPGTRSRSYGFRVLLAPASPFSDDACKGARARRNRGMRGSQGYRLSR